jgi:integrase
MSRVSGTKVCLSPEFVDSLSPPSRGEIWIGDNHLDHFGIRAWAGKKGGNKAFAIRLRDKSGKLVRETYDPSRDWSSYFWEEGWEKPDSFYLELARYWAKDRIAVHQGKPSWIEYLKQSDERRGRRLLDTTLGKTFERGIRQLRKRSKRPTYADQIEELVDRHINQELRDQTLGSFVESHLARAITENSIPSGNARRLRAFVNGALRERVLVHGPLGLKLDALHEHCRELLDARGVRYPKILEIAEADFKRFFALLENEPAWRQALAIRLYFATGARMQQVLRAKWSDIVNEQWCPFTPDERGCWFEAIEGLNETALEIIAAIATHHAEESIQSLYLFPSNELGSSQPIKTVQRMWSRTAGTMGWNDLPLSHVVRRLHPRTNPSYSWGFSRLYLGSLKREMKPVVSKIVKRRRTNRVFAMTYMAEHKPS